MDIKFFYTNLHLKDVLAMEFTACQSELMPDGVLDIIYHVWRISLLCGSGSYLRHKVVDQTQNIWCQRTNYSA